MQASMIMRVAWWAGVFTVAALSWHAGKLTWLLWGDQNSAVVVADQPQESASRQLKNSYPVWHLFGRLQQARPQVVDVKRDAPKTRLRLQLKGVVVSGFEQDSGAIVAEKGRAAEFYKVDDTLPGDAMLVNVFADHILLSRNGALEKLTFDEFSNDRKANSISEVAPSTNPETADIDTPEQFLNVAQARLKIDPAGALASVGLAPAAGNSESSGYVYNGNNPMLAAMNMQKGDIIRSLNGHLLGDMHQDQSKLEEFYDSGTLVVEIERAGATFTVTYPIP